MAAAKPKTWVDRSAIPSMLLFGTMTVVTGKLLFEMEVNGKKFEKPWWQVVAMFLGMLSCLFVFYGQKFYFSLTNRGEKLLSDKPVDANDPPAETGRHHWMQYVRILPPAMCDLFATGLMNVGLLWIPASIWQLLRGSMVIFSSILSIIFLHRKLYPFNWVGICTVLLAMVAVGVACIEGGSGAEGSENDANKKLIGMFMVVIAQVIQASQIVIEEFLLKNVKAAPSLIVGIEGFWGTVSCLFIVLPILQFIPEPYGEDTIETFQMMGDSGALVGVSILYIFAILAYNLAGMCVTMQYTAIHRTILEAMRTLCIWVTDLFIYYVVSKYHGEKWTNWSFLELVGFVFLVTGTFIYNKVFRIPGLYYPPAK